MELLYWYILFEIISDYILYILYLFNLLNLSIIIVIYDINNTFKE